VVIYDIKAELSGLSAQTKLMPFGYKRRIIALLLRSCHFFQAAATHPFSLNNHAKNAINDRNSRFNEQLVSVPQLGFKSFICNYSATDWHRCTRIKAGLSSLPAQTKLMPFGYRVRQKTKVVSTPVFFAFSPVPLALSV
jgi:hypothetical protein